MEYPEFSNLQFGKIYYCYNPQNAAPSNSLLDEIESAFKSTFENYTAEFLPTNPQTDGVVVVRRFNLGVACAYGVLAVPTSGCPLSSCINCLVKCLLDVSSFRSDPVLFLNERTLSTSRPVLDDCSTVLGGVSSTYSSKPFYKFWTNLRNNSADVPLLERKPETYSKIDNIDLKSLGYVKRNNFPGLGGILNNFIVCGSDSAEAIQTEDAVEEKDYEEDKFSELEEVDLEVEEEPDQIDKILAEKEELAKQIALLIKTYILKYGAIDDEKIQNLLTGKMTLANDKISHLMVNNDCKIVLQDYNETVLKVGGPLPTSLYILFLRHPEGILLKDIENYRKELMDIYCLVANKVSAEAACVIQITTPTDPRINQEISRIRRTVKAHIPVGDLAEAYSIIGERGNLFYIPIAKRSGFVSVAPKF